MGQLIENMFTKKWLEREVAFLIDIVICATIAIFPRIGFIISALYFFLKDALPFGGASSFGKSIYGLKVKDADDQPVRHFWRKTIVRNLIIVIPILNLVDIYYFLKTGVRLADEWTSTKVEK
ncbi:MAG: hypothetical protein J6Y82_03250 [Bacteroidales bacterium]|nr:hypothetical protein [Bacteroidales bacterium]